MRRLVIGVLCGLALVGVAAGVTVAVADDGGSKGSRHDVLEGKATGFVPVNHAGDSPQGGDYFVESFDLTRDGKAAGHDIDVCVIGPGDELEAVCDFKLDLDGRGLLTASAVLGFAPDGEGGFMPAPFDAAITGGTGRFTRAAGTVHGEFSDHEHVTLAVEIA